jgi:hypothetical protein
MPSSTVLRRPLKSFRRVTGAPLFATLAALALAGCGMFGSSTTEGGTSLYPCPAVGVLQETENVTLVRGSGADLTDVVLKAEMGRVVSKCTYNTSASTITVDLAFDGLAELGPAATSREFTLQTFVAVTRRYDAFDKKQVYNVPVVFEAGQRQMRFVQSVDGTELPYGEDADGRIYQILIGFQLTPEQLQYNRTMPYSVIR